MSRLTTASERERLARKAIEARRRQEARRFETLKRLPSWPEGMPPLPAIGSGIGTLVGLEKDGLVARVGTDTLGEPRFVLTDDGRRAAAEFGA